MTELSFALEAGRYPPVGFRPLAFNGRDLCWQRLVKRQAGLQALLEQFGCLAVSLSEPRLEGPGHGWSWMVMGEALSEPLSTWPGPGRKSVGLLGGKGGPPPPG